MDKSSLQARNQDAIAEKKFAGYTMLDHLGKGGMGDVYKARQIGLDRIVALKILPSMLARSEGFSERFFTEAYAISRLQHQNIVTIYDYGDENGQKFIAMQYIQGTTLSKVIKENKRLDYARIIGIAKQIGRGLKYAHQNEIIHRDIKSGNIMMESDDKVYISDFGIAKVIDAPGITTTGMAMGTPEYMSPEQCEGGIVDGQSDIYALGIIIYEMVTGKPPFLADTPLTVAYKQVHETPHLLGKKFPDIPLRLELIVAKCLKKNKADRYLNADELLRDLDSAHIEMAPEEASKTAVPSDLRITDRRGGERRHLDDPMAISRGYLWGTLGLFALIIGAIVFLYVRPAPPTPVGMRWLAPTTLNKDEAEITFAFANQVLLSSMIVETRWQTTNGATPESSYPKTVTLEIEGHKPLRFSLTETEAPQILNLGGVVVGNGKLHFENGLSGSTSGAAAQAAKPMTVREVRFLGLPYD